MNSYGPKHNKHHRIAGTVLLIKNKISTGFPVGYFF